MPMCNLIEYSDNYSNISESLWQYYRDEVPLNNDDVVTSFPGNSASFELKYKITDETEYDGTKYVETMVPLKYLKNFLRTLEIPLIDCKIKLFLTWSANRVIYNTAANQATTFDITDTKLFVPIVTLSTQDNPKLLHQLNSGFKRTIHWEKYQSKVTMQVQNRYLDYLMDPSFHGVNRLFVLSFSDSTVRTEYRRYFRLNVEIKDYNVMIDGENVSNQPVKIDMRKSDNIKKIETGQEEYYTTGCLLDYSYFEDSYKGITMDLSKQQALDTDPEAIQEISFTGNLSRRGGATFFFSY